ncbi:hypothetical protein V493_07812, partial [Pseudogymnoascus sp. VKM F-4281 (FW-2241)]
MSVITKEAKINLAIEAIRTSRNLSRRAAAKLYKVPESSLRLRMNGHLPLPERRPANIKLSKLEEEVIIRNILELDSRGFAPRLAGVEDMANFILESRGGTRVGGRWAQRFIQRQPALKTRLNRVYDFQRALCEDSELIGAWFRLVENMRAKYGVLDCDFYNFDETGFMMGVICPAMVVTHADRRGRGKAVQPGNREWATAIACINSEGWSVPPFLVVQGKNHLSNWYTDGGLPPNWVIKPTTFTAAYKESMTAQNCQAGFRGAGLVPFDPQAVLSKLDVKLRTPTPSSPSTVNTTPWVSQTPSNPTEALSQTTLVRNRIARHQGSSPTPLFKTVVALAKGTERLAHENTLLSAEVRSLRSANEALSKRRRAKKARVREGGALIVEDAQDIIAQEDVDEQ